MLLFEAIAIVCRSAGLGQHYVQSCRMIFGDFIVRLDLSRLGTLAPPIIDIGDPDYRVPLSTFCDTDCSAQFRPHGYVCSDGLIVLI